jgi:hypothetical protein
VDRLKPGTWSDDEWVMRIGRARVRGDEAGFTLVELMGAVLVLIVGLLGTITLVQTADRNGATSNQRIGATNLSRELLEQTRTLTYPQMNAAGIEGALKTRPGLGSGSPWKIERRNVDYTIQTSVCTYDDPVDGIATTTAPLGYCPRGGATADTDPDGDDFRRVTFQVSWSDRGRTRSVTQTELIVNPSGGLGPRITKFDPTVAVITSGNSASFVVETATTAKAIRWSADDGVSQGSVAGPGTSFTFTWDLKPLGALDQVLDGTYQLVAQAFNDRDIPGEAKVAVIRLNRFEPFPPPALVGGHNTRIGDVVDLEWAANRERDVIGYRVYYAGNDDVVRSSDDVQVCPPVATEWLAPELKTCQDATHPGKEGIWYVVALDRDTANAVREGEPRTLLVDDPDAQPEVPAGPLTATETELGTTLEWDAPASGSTPQFYRVYRDGTGFDARFAVVTGGDTSFSDPDDGSHEYWVSAVDDEFNESDLLGEVASP